MRIVALSIFLVSTAACTPAVYEFENTTRPDPKDFRTLAPSDIGPSIGRKGSDVFVNGNGETCELKGGAAARCIVDGQPVEISDVLSGSI